MAVELGVLKTVNSIDKEDKKLRPVVVDNVSKYDCLFYDIRKHKHTKVKIRVDESVTSFAQVNRRIRYHHQERVERTTPEVRRSWGSGVSAR